MSYVDTLAEEVRSKIPKDLLPDGDTIPLFRLYALLALTKGAEVTAADVHDAWAVWMSSTDPQHPALRPFTELSPEKRQEDQVFVDAIRDVAAQNPWIR